VVASDDLLASDFDHELVILNLRDGVYYGLQDVGARIWKLVQQPVTLKGIRDVLVSEYDVDPVRCERDVRALLEALMERGLVKMQEHA
jgi:hypothetical protein